ncbi:Capsule polysaccharide export protein [Legionella busanensis]|uniref:Capsule polysaccharide export protein n=1 Tax=Legionella busanensis TaxID=190655 RepID=A0A378JL10_9GAMM|nr:hypothetical protein [Legionella busanensis]STX51874.1 Capsule polysaccharide export protein [Legionella busanensis]
MKPQGKNSKFNKILTDFKWIHLQLKSDPAQYQLAQQAFSIAVINLSYHQNLLFAFDSPNLSDKPSILTPFFALVNLFLLFLILSLLAKVAVIIIKEHRG